MSGAASAEGDTVAPAARIASLLPDTSTIAASIAAALGCQDDSEQAASGGNSLTQLECALSPVSSGAPDAAEVADMEAYESGPNDASDDDAADNDGDEDADRETADACAAATADDDDATPAGAATAAAHAGADSAAGTGPAPAGRSLQSPPCLLLTTPPPMSPPAAQSPISRSRSRCGLGRPARRHDGE